MAWTAAQQARPASTAPTSIDEVLQAVRSDLQGERADILAKNLTLTSAQAAKFWPLFETYQKEQNVIMDEQLRGIQRFIEGFDQLDDAGALGLINAHIDRDARMAALRQKWLGEFQKALNTKLAVRVMQIDRRLSLAHQIVFTSKIPLAH
jgi:Spy/CpxP family protein refolding chaperone